MENPVLIGWNQVQLVITGLTKSIFSIQVHIKIHTWIWAKMYFLNIFEAHKIAYTYIIQTQVYEIWI